MHDCLSQLSAQMGTPPLKPERKSRFTFLCRKRGKTPNLFSNTTDLACHICSRVPNANHDHSLPHETVWVLVLPAVNIAALELGDSYEGRAKSPESQAEVASARGGKFHSYYVTTFSVLGHLLPILQHMVIQGKKYSLAATLWPSSESKPRNASLRMSAFKFAQYDPPIARGGRWLFISLCLCMFNSLSLSVTLTMHFTNKSDPSHMQQNCCSKETKCKPHNQLCNSHLK